jgi:hypothetical protein
MVYASPTWENAMNAHLLKFQRQQNQILSSIGILDRRIFLGEVHMALTIPYMYYYVTEVCRKQAEVMKISKFNCTCSWTRRRHA